MTKPVVDESEIKNHYKNIPKKFQEEERNYDNESKIKIKLPFRMCIIGSSGSGKTNFLITLIEDMNAFDKILIFAKNTEEPLYATLIDNVREVEKKTGSSILTVGNTIEELPELKSIDKKNNTLCIIDDMVNEKSKLLGKVADYYTMGRKQYVSTVFLSQSYFKIPKIIRENTGYFVFTKINGNRDLFMILKDFELGVTEEQLLKLYNTAASGFPNVFMIDRETNDKSLIFRKNFKGIPPPDSAETKATSKIVVEDEKTDEKTDGKTDGKTTKKDKLKRARPAPPNTSSHAPTTSHSSKVDSYKEPPPDKMQVEDEEFYHPRMHIEDDYYYYPGMQDIENEGEMDWEGSGIKNKKRRKRKGKGTCSDAELRRMLRVYGFKP